MTKLIATPFTRCRWCHKKRIVGNDGVCVACRPDYLAAHYDDKHAEDVPLAPPAEEETDQTEELRKRGFRWRDIPFALRDWGWWE